MYAVTRPISQQLLFPPEPLSSPDPEPLSSPEPSLDNSSSAWTRGHGAAPGEAQASATGRLLVGGFMAARHQPQLRGFSTLR